MRKGLSYCIQGTAAKQTCDDWTSKAKGTGEYSLVLLVKVLLLMDNGYK
jgi:hypothetical protein